MPVGGIEAGLARIPPALEQASRLLGETAAGTLRRVHLPLLQPAIAAGALLVFVDAMKELPATLLLRPANFDTLATWLYAEAARGTYEEGAIAALAIVLAGLLPVILLARIGSAAWPKSCEHERTLATRRRAHGLRRRTRPAHRRRRLLAVARCRPHRLPARAFGLRQDHGAARDRGLRAGARGQRSGSATRCCPRPPCTCRPSSAASA